MAFHRAIQIRGSDNKNSFVICNDGYTIERYIHGWEASYNDIQPWKFVDIPSTFGGQQGQYETHQIRTRKELLDLFSNEHFSSNKCLQVSFFIP
jgi:pyruvate decarboxylase